MAKPKAYLTAEEHAKLSPEQQTQYEPHAASGGFMFGLEPVNGWRLEDVDGLGSAKARIQRERDEMRERLKSYDGVDLEEARAALEKVKNMTGSDGKPSKELETARATFAEELAKRDQKYATDTKALEDELVAHLKTAARTTALAKHGGDPDLLGPHMEAALRVVKNDGKRALRVYGPDGTELLSKVSGSAGEAMPPEEYVGTVLRQRFPAAFPGTGSTGSGATGSTRTGGGNGRFTITREQARDPRAYQAVRAEAEKAGKMPTVVD